MSHRAFRLNALPLCCTFLGALIMPHDLVAQKPKEIPGAEVDRSVVAVLLRQGITKLRVVAHLDLSKPFGTVSQWTFVAVQDVAKPAEYFDDRGPIFLCLVKGVNPDCALNLYQQSRADTPSSESPHHLFAARVVYSRPEKKNPQLFLKACGPESANGNCDIATALYTYDKVADRFIRVFLNLTGRNNNQGTRFVENGPLQGSVIVNNPTNGAPYTYWIDVYRAGNSGRYSRILRYRGVTHYSDGNPLAVADSEMPEILHRLALWQTGDPLPIPPHLPHGCRTLFMRKGEEWCK